MIYNGVIPGVILLRAGAATATTLTAKPSDDGNDEVSQFWINSTNKTGTGLLDFDEITLFTGVHQTTDPLIPVEQPYLDGIPAITGISNFGSAPGSNAPWGLWSFCSQQNGVIEISEAPDEWVHQLPLSADPSPVPLPASAGLLAAALGALGARRRQYRKGEHHR
jgi:hypothetical protein